MAFSPDAFNVEHIVPRVRFGSDDPSNLALACSGCNSAKYTATSAIDPIMNVEVPLYHPRRDRWMNHFAWSDDYTEIQPHTAVGRATVARLKLNRPQVVNLRRVLFAAGNHPPSQPLGTH